MTPYQISSESSMETKSIKIKGEYCLSEKHSRRGKFESSDARGNLHVWEGIQMEME